MLDKVNSWVKANKQRVLATHDFLHTHAEVSWKELHTTDFLQKQLNSLDIESLTFEEHTGVVGLWGDSQSAKKIGIRADMDALWQLVDGSWQANHSCGHDAHMTMVLYAITCLKECGYTPPGQVKVVFQPAEETGNGAKAILKRGILDDLDALVGIHVRPIQEMSYGKASPAIYHGATTLMKGRIFGVQSHAARPHLGVNVIDSFAAIVAAVNAIKLDPTIAYSAKVTTVRAGSDNINTISDFAEFGIDLRAQTNEAMEQLVTKVTDAIVAAGAANGAKVEYEIAATMVAAEPNEGMEKLVSTVITEVLGSDALVAPPVTPGGEDFHFYATELPHIQATLVGLGTDLAPGLHHPNMTFNREAILDGVKILALTLVKWFEEQGK
ncbi:amidohydrolase [Bacillus sp. HMF5848]|uniref:M20 peptidase aminoacylase family protein n=1 Tax=Bacillus sp. HMF5848 TaxID=2495421 RepID=UPI000F7BA787|nr:M20 peptidase aminoacylase family protein [Bacillus sp. HMF5848]RSK28378.1 amidohydrolase [Bacillus sp. HMF5848]